MIVISWSNISINKFLVLDALLVALFGGAGYLAAFFIRKNFSYPRCPGDEENWVQIFHQLASCEFLPVSGPGFVDLPRFVREMRLCCITHKQSKDTP